MVMTQYSLKAGIEKFGADADEAILKEFSSIHLMDTFIPKKAGSLSYEQRKEALRTIMFLKEKRDDIIKGRACADGSTQRGKYTKAEVSSPTVAT